MDALTRRQRRVLERILRFFEKEERPPTTRELADALKCHVKTVYQFLLALERKGYIERRKGRIRLREGVRRSRDIPLVGRVAAGTPILAVENIEGYLPLRDLFPGQDGLFALRVRGDSMVGAAICDGDQVIVRKQSSIDQGEIGVAIVDGEATVKRIWCRANRVRLTAEHPRYEPMEFDLKTKDVRIAGKVVGVIRKM